MEKAVLRTEEITTMIFPMEHSSVEKKWLFSVKLHNVGYNLTAVHISPS